jgi:hypothetical protein
MVWQNKKMQQIKSVKLYIVLKLSPQIKTTVVLVSLGLGDKRHNDNIKSQHTAFGFFFSMACISSSSSFLLFFPRFVQVMIIHHHYMNYEIFEVDKDSAAA